MNNDFLKDLAKIARNPISKVFGFDRGLPIDRFYMEKYLGKNASLIKGRVLEFGDSQYTKMYSSSNDVISNILTADEDAGNGSIIGDITQGGNFEPELYDCVICCQTLSVIYDFRSAVKTIYKILKPGGSLLVTVPGITQVSRYDMDRWGDYWRFTNRSLGSVLEESFDSGYVEVETYGNPYACVAFLLGGAVEDVDPRCLQKTDVDYQLLICARATK